MKQRKRKLALGAEGQGADPGSELSTMTVGKNMPHVQTAPFHPFQRGKHYPSETATKYTHHSPPSPSPKHCPGSLFPTEGNLTCSRHLGRKKKKKKKLNTPEWPPAQWLPARTSPQMPARTTIKSKEISPSPLRSTLRIYYVSIYIQCETHPSQYRQKPTSIFNTSDFVVTGFPLKSHLGFLKHIILTSKLLWIPHFLNPCTTPYRDAVTRI